MSEAQPSGFVPPPYPHDRLAELQVIANAVPGGAIDVSVGTPVDPLPEVVVTALHAALPTSTGYPPTIGSVTLRRAAVDWLARRCGVSLGDDEAVACVGTKEVVASLPRMLSLRTPGRDTVLYPAASYPTYAMGALLAGLRPVPVPVDDAWRLDLSRVAPEDAQRALVLWCNDPSNPTGVTATPAEMAAHVEWARSRGIVVASDECYAEFTYDDHGEPAAPVTALSCGTEGVLAVHSLSKRSNMAGLRAGFIAGDRALVQYLGEVRKHAGLMVPGPVQAAAAAALADDAHVDVQRERYARRRAVAVPAFQKVGLVHDGGPSTFYLWLRDTTGERDAWTITADLAATGLIVAPGEFYGPEGRHHVRIALTITDEDLARVCERLVRTDAP